MDDGEKQQTASARFYPVWGWGGATTEPHGVASLLECDLQSALTVCRVTAFCPPAHQTRQQLRALPSDQIWVRGRLVVACHSVSPEAASLLEERWWPP